MKLFKQLEYYKGRVKLDSAKSADVTPFAEVEVIWKNNNNYILPWVESKTLINGQGDPYDLILLLSNTLSFFYTLELSAPSHCEPKKSVFSE